MFIIGVTGGIGSGKSTVCKFIEESGYPVFYSDIVAKNLANTNKELQKEIINFYGPQSYINNVYNTKYISSLVFTNKASLNNLNNIFKKFIKKEFENFCLKNKNSKFIFYESALIYEHKKEQGFSSIICVYVPTSTVIERIEKRDNLSKQDILNRLNNQLSPEEKKEKADIVVYNVGTTEELLHSTQYVLNNLNKMF